MVTTSYEGTDDEEEVDMVPANDNYYQQHKVVSDSESDVEAKENLSEEIDDKIEVTPKTILKQKVVCVMKTLQVSFNVDTNKTVEQAA